jgi:hypothetical protein
VLFITSSFIACKKDKEKQSECRVTRLIRENGQTYDFTYGDDGKLKSMLSLPTNELSSFSYNGNKTTVNVTKNGNFNLKLFVTNNAAGLATNILIETLASGKDWFNQAITYEGQKIVSNEVTDSGGNDSAIASYIWKDGNPSVLINDGDIFHYEYYTEKPFQPGDWRDIQQLIGGYRIYQYQNLLQSSEINGNKTYYTYKFDESGRIIQSTSTSKNISTVFDIKYECN